MAQKNHGAAEFGGNEGNFGETRFARKCAEVAGVINEKTGLAFRVVLPICSLMLFSFWRVTQGIARLDRKLEDSWYITDMERWSRQFRKDNPAVQIPDAREIYEQNTDRKTKLIQ